MIRITVLILGLCLGVNGSLIWYSFGSLNWYVNFAYLVLIEEDYMPELFKKIIQLNITDIYGFT